MEALYRARMFAEQAHQGQTYGPYPYKYHLQMVLEIAQELQCNEQIQVACYLHDVLEDSGVTYNDIKTEFGYVVAEIVYAVTDELGRNRNERKEKTYPKIKKMLSAQIVKMCDRLANIRHSKRTGSRMFDLYKKEHNQFIDSIVTPDSKINIITVALYKMMLEELSENE